MQNVFTWKIVSKTPEIASKLDDLAKWSNLSSQFKQPIGARLLTVICLIIYLMQVIIQQTTLESF